MKHNLSLSNDRITLKPLERTHIEKLRKLRNREENRKWFVFSDIISHEQQIQWYNGYKDKQNDYVFSIFSNEMPDEFIGSVALYNVNAELKKVEFGRIMIDKEKVKAKGVGVDITLLACDIAFKDLRVNEVHLEVFEDNIAAIKTYERAGFKKYSEHLTNNRVMILMKKYKITNLNTERGEEYGNSII